MKEPVIYEKFVWNENLVMNDFLKTIELMKIAELANNLIVFIR